MAKEIDLLEKLNELPPHVQRSIDGADNSDLSMAAANVLGVSPEERSEDLRQLVDMAVAQRVGDTRQMDGWLRDQLSVMGKAMGGMTSGSRLKDLLMFLRKVEQVIEHAKQQGRV